jgi:hypothetical protein
MPVHLGSLGESIKMVIQRNQGSPAASAAATSTSSTTRTTAAPTSQTSRWSLPSSPRCRPAARTPPRQPARWNTGPHTTGPMFHRTAWTQSPQPHMTREPRRSPNQSRGRRNLVLRRLAGAPRGDRRRADQMLIQRGRGGQRQLAKPPCRRGEGNRVRLRPAHSSASGRAARSSATCPAENTRPARASARPSCRSRTSSVSDSTSIVSCRRSSSRTDPW